MVSMTLAIPPKLREQMRKHPEINWSEVARQAIKKRAEELEAFKEFIKDSEMTQEDALRLGRKVRRAVGKRVLKEWSSTQTSSSQPSSKTE